MAGTAFARSQAYSTILIALALYANQFGTSGAVEGLFGTAFALAQLVIVLPLGRAVDAYDAKRVLLAGLLLNVGVFVGFTLVENAAHVILVRALQGIGANVLWIAGSAVVGELSPGGSSGRWLGTYNQVGAFSSFAGDAIGGVLLYAYGFTITYAALSVVTIGAAVAVLALLRDDPGGIVDTSGSAGVAAFRRLLNRTAVRALVLFRLGFGFGKMAVVVFIPIYAHTRFGMSPLAVGGILAGGKLVKSVFQGIIGEYTDRIGCKHYFVASGGLVYALGAAMVPLAETATATFSSVRVAAFGSGLTVTPAFCTLFLAYGVIGIADSLRLPASMALFVEMGERFGGVASSLSLRSVACKVGEVTGPFAVGVVWDMGGVAAPFLLAAGVLVITTAAFASMYRVGPVPSGTPTPGD